jgi:hypothetical protein
VELKTLPGGGHSVFTIHFVDDGTGPTARALTEILGYFRERLAA